MDHFWFTEAKFHTCQIQTPLSQDKNCSMVLWLLHSAHSRGTKLPTNWYQVSIRGCVLSFSRLCASMCACMSLVCVHGCVNEVSALFKDQWLSSELHHIVGSWQSRVHHVIKSHGELHTHLSSWGWACYSLSGIAGTYLSYGFYLWLCPAKVYSHQRIFKSIPDSTLRTFGNWLVWHPCTVVTSAVMLWAGGLTTYAWPLKPTITSSLPSQPLNTTHDEAPHL